MKRFKEEQFSKNYMSRYPHEIPGYGATQVGYWVQLAQKFGWDIANIGDLVTKFLGSAWEQCVYDVNQNIPTYDQFLNYLIKNYKKFLKEDVKVKRHHLEELAINYYYEKLKD